ncbi:MAG TPA: ankyrin repeat domain-containing protein [bacterium]|jgi:ankyrin repeat protein
MTPEQIREFVIAGHWDLPKVQAMLAEDPDLLNARQQWAEDDFETAIQAASHAGSPHVAEFLLAQGAPMAIYTAAMLGRTDIVEEILRQDPEQINTLGAHGIPLLPHAAFSGSVDLVQMLYERGAKTGVSMALSNAVSRGHAAVVRWILAHGTPKLDWKNYEGKTALDIATARGDDEMAQLLRQAQ